MVKIFIGCAANNEDIESQAVLEWSIRKHASESVNITWMQLDRVPGSVFEGWNTATWATPFSGFRWAIPEMCDFQGKAIYMDSDVIVQADILELWNQKFKPRFCILGKGGGQWRICVSMFDCAAAKPYLPSIESMKIDPRSHNRLCSLMRPKVQTFRGEWNCLDREIGNRELSHPDIKAIHYTRMNSQPQLRHAIPRLKKQNRKHWFDGPLEVNKYPKINSLFDTLLEEAKAQGFHPDRYIVEPFGKYKKRNFLK